MSEQEKNERDIDDVLASIDAMLNQKNEKHDASVEKEAFIQQASADSTAELGLSSTPTIAAAQAEREVLEDEHDSSQEKITKQHRILLTEALLAPTGQETLPLWVEQDDDVSIDTLQGFVPDIATSEQASVSENSAQAVIAAEDPPLEPKTKQEAQLGTNIAAEITAAEPEESNVIRINPDQLEQLVELISLDVSQQLNQQMQDLLPKLVSASLVRHLASLKKDTE